MRVTFLGTGTAVPAADRAPSGLLVRGREERLVLDPGPGTLRRVLRAGVDPRQVDAILLTHLHLDHAADLPYWLFVFRNPNFARRRPLVIAGGSDLPAHLDDLRRTYGWQMVPAEETRAVDLTREEFPSGEFRIAAFPVPHTPGSLGLRIEELATGRILAFTGDTGPGPEAAAVGEGADLFILECSYPEGARANGHLQPSTALGVVRESGCRSAALTHFHPGWDPSREVSRLLERDPVPGTVITAFDGLELEV